jgi:hypothetical protein
MQVTIELERQDALTVRHWEQFLEQARRAGAIDDTPVAEYMPDGTDVLCAWRVSLPDSPSPAPQQVTLPTWLVHDLLSVVRIVAQSDGDVRGLELGAQKALQNAYDHLLLPILGENPDEDGADSKD